MDEPGIQSPSLLARLLQDPRKLRRRSRILALLTAVLAGVAGSGALSSDVLSSVLTAVSWLFVPPLAAGIGIGDAFFLRHGIGHRRVALTALAGLLASILSCVILAVITTSSEQAMLTQALLYGVLVLGMIAVLASGIAIAAGKGGGYLARRIQDVDDTGW